MSVTLSEETFQAASRDEIEAVQLHHPKATLDRVSRHVPHYQRAFQSIGFDPGIARVRVESRMSMDDEGAGKIAKRTEAAIKDPIGVTVSVEVVAPGVLPRSEGKAVRVIDTIGRSIDHADRIAFAQSQRRLESTAPAGTHFASSIEYGA